MFFKFSLWRKCLFCEVSHSGNLGNTYLLRAVHRLYHLKMRIFKLKKMHKKYAFLFGKG